MPYKSDKQRRYMHAKHPEIAARWDAEAKKKKVAKALQVKVVGHGFIDPQLPKVKAAKFKNSAGQPRKVREGDKRAMKNAIAVENLDWWNRGPIPALVHNHQRVYKRMNPEKKLAAQKKVSAATSVVGSSIGLAGLGMLAASKKYPGTLKQLPKVTAVGAGVGGIGGFNYASIQNQEAKKKTTRQKNVYVVRNKRQIKSIKSGLEPVTKGLTTMDFGLNDVRQGESVISKRRKWDTDESAAVQTKSEKNAKRSATAGTVGATGVLGWYGSQLAADSQGPHGKYPGYKTQKYNLKGQTKNMREAYTTATKAGWKGAEPLKRRQTVKPLLKFGKTAVKNNPHASAGKAAGAVALAGIGTSMAISNRAGNQAREATRLRAQNRRDQLAKSWSEDHPKVKMQAFSIKNTDAKGRQSEYLPTQASTHPRGKSAILRRPKYQVVASPDDSLSKTPGKKSIGSMTPNQRLRHKDAVTFANAYKTKAKKVTTSTGYEFKHEVGKGLVFKAYNPEEKRLRRTEHQATALSVASGASGAGAFMFGRKAVGAKGTGMKGLRAKSLPHFKTGLKNAGKAGGLGVTAVGLAVASDRVRNYRHGRGSTYRALHR